MLLVNDQQFEGPYRADQLDPVPRSPGVFMIRHTHDDGRPFVIAIGEDADVHAAVANHPRLQQDTPDRITVIVHSREGLSKEQRADIVTRICRALALTDEEIGQT